MNCFTWFSPYNYNYPRARLQLHMERKWGMEWKMNWYIVHMYRVTHPVYPILSTNYKLSCSPVLCLLYTTVLPICQLCAYFIVPPPPSQIRVQYCVGVYLILELFLKHGNCEREKSFHHHRWQILPSFRGVMLKWCCLAHSFYRKT